MLEKSVVFANSALVDTQGNFTVAKPSVAGKTYILAVNNPSTVTDLTVKVMSSRTINSVAVDSLVTTLVVPKAKTINGTAVNTYEYLIDGLFVESALKAIVSNNTVLGASDGFTAYFQLIEVR